MTLIYFNVLGVEYFSLQNIGFKIQQDFLPDKEQVVEERGVHSFHELLILRHLPPNTNKYVYGSNSCYSNRAERR